MWLSDFEEAIAAMKEHSVWRVFSKIEVSAFGDRFIFTPNDREDFYFVYFRDTKAILEYYVDTWHHPEHYRVIYEGDK